MSTYLVTGAAGFIGHKTAQLLLGAGHEVIGVDDLNDYYDVKLKERRLESLKFFETFHFSQYSITDFKKMKTLFQKYAFTAVINLAARAGVRFSLEEPTLYMNTNAMGTLILLELMKEFKVKKFIVASTSSLYAGQSLPFTEDLPVNQPISPYAATKKSAEVMAYTYHSLYGIDVSIVRYFTVYGPGSRPDMAQFRFLQGVGKGEALTIYGNGEQSRDFTYVDDIAKGTIKALKEVGYDIFNLGGGNNPYSIKEMIGFLEKGLGKTANITYLDSHKADMEVTWANIEKAKKILQWEPEISFEKGLHLCVEDYLKYQDFYNQISL